MKGMIFLPGELKPLVEAVSLLSDSWGYSLVRYLFLNLFLVCAGVLLGYHLYPHINHADAGSALTVSWSPEVAHVEAQRSAALLISAKEIEAYDIAIKSILSTFKEYGYSDSDIQEQPVLRDIIAKAMDAQKRATEGFDEVMAAQL